jgi:ABC-type branched-subunit amino acid transport system ATPase component/MFS family permease
VRQRPYPLACLGLLVLVSQFHAYAFFLLGPEINRELGIQREALAGMVALITVAISLATLPIAAYVQDRPRRGHVASVGAIGWSVATVATAFVGNAAGLAMAVILFGIASATIVAVHTPLLVDWYPAEVRVRTLSVYQSAAYAGNVVAPALVGILSGLLAFTWRGVFLVMGIVSLAASLVSVRLAGTRPDSATDSLHPGFFDVLAQVRQVPTVRRLLAAFAVLGMMLIPLYTFLFFFLDERWGMGPGGRAVFFAYGSVAGIAALIAFGRRMEDLFQQDARRLLHVIGAAFGSFAIFLTFAVLSPAFAVMVVAFGLAVAALGVVTPSLNAVLLSVVPTEARPHVAALEGIFVAAVGGTAGLLLLSGIAEQFGPAASVVSLALPGTVAALMLATAGDTVVDDLRRAAGHVQVEPATPAAPLLMCRAIDFAYNGAPVLIGVDLAVKDGEILALLGPNGAGKSTLLGVMAGLLLPQSGVVRFEGRDVTYVQAERRAMAGVVLVPGGKGVFASLSVVDNLRLFLRAAGRGHGRTEDAVASALDAFPELAARRDTRAANLSGGEQHLLELARAVVLEPRLLLVDELALGLAPRRVADMVQMLATLRDAGTAVVVVEQSPTLALALADRAVFIDGGRIRFDGPVTALRDRTDLLRSVYLAGAAASVQS